MSDEEYYKQASSSKNKNKIQQNFSVCGSLIVEPTRISLKKVKQEKELQEIFEQNQQSQMSTMTPIKNKHKSDRNRHHLKNLQGKSASSLAMYNYDNDINIETIGKCLFKQLFISDSDKRKYFTIFVKVNNIYLIYLTY